MNQTAKAAKRRAKADPFQVAARSLQRGDRVRPLNLDARTTRGACA